MQTNSPTQKLKSRSSGRGQTGKWTRDFIAHFQFAQRALRHFNRHRNSLFCYFCQFAYSIRQPVQIQPRENHHEFPLHLLPRATKINLYFRFLRNANSEIASCGLVGGGKQHTLFSSTGLVNGFISLHSSHKIPLKFASMKWSFWCFFFPLSLIWEFRINCNNFNANFISWRKSSDLFTTMVNLLSIVRNGAVLLFILMDILL